MRNWIKIVSFTLIVVLFSSIIPLRAEAAVSDTVTFAYDDRNVKVKVYSRDVGDTKNSPLFKYGDLINRAIAYKQDNLNENVSIKFAIYKASLNTYVGFNPNHESYGYVKGNDHGGANSEKLVYSLVKAAKQGVNVQFVYHKDINNDVYNYLNGFLNDVTAVDPTKTIGDFLQFKKVAWGNESSQQMHAKFMTVSHYKADNGGTLLDTVYISTGNIDEHDNAGIPIAKDWVQSGTLINGHPELMQSFNNYFELLYAHADNQQNFHQAVKTKHSLGQLNYDDAHFSSYFFPIPTAPAGNYVYIPETGDMDPANGDAWDVNFNPIAKYVDRMRNMSGNVYFKANVYHMKLDNFNYRLYDEMASIYNSQTSGLKHFRWVNNVNSYEHIRPSSLFNNIGIIKSNKLTHAKDYLFAFSDASEYYTITGSTNLKLDEFASKANASIVIKEFTSEHPVYDAYKAIYNYQYN